MSAATPAPPRSSRAFDPQESPRSSAWLIAGLFLVGAGIRALQFIAPFHWPFHWDETVLGTAALRILAGAFPANAGVEYFGAAPAYPLAAWFALAGPSVLANDVFAFAVSLLILWTSWLVLRRFLEWPGTAFGLAVLAVPPLFLAQWSFTTTGSHAALLALGNVCLLATHTIFVAEPGRRRAIFLLGLLAGFGWWLDPLIVVYLAPFALLGLRTGLLWQPRVGWVVLGGFIGGLPEWLYEVQYFPSARFMLSQSGGVPVAPLHERLSAIVGSFLPRLLGLSFPMERIDVVAFLVVALPLWLGAVAWAVYRARVEFAWIVRRPGHIGRGHVILWITAAANLALVLVSHRPIDHYYLLPLYSVLPCWMGALLDRLRRQGPGLPAVALLALLAFHGRVQWQGTLGATDPGGPRWANLTREVGPALHWLEERGIDRAYLVEAFHLSSHGMTYLSGGRVVLSELWRENILDHERLVDAAPNPPIVATKTEAPQLQSGLDAIGVDVRETRIGELLVLELAPRFTTTFAPLRRDGWTIRASDRADRAADLLDGDAATSWDTGGEQLPGQWLAVDLGAPRLVTRVDLLAIDWQEMPGGLRVEVSADGQRWQPVTAVPQYWGPMFFSEHHAFLKVRRGRVQAIFPPVTARHLRLVQTAAVRAHTWSARELFAYGPGGPRPALPRPGDLTAALRREGIRFVYANHWLSAWIQVDSHGAIGAQDSNMNTSDLGRVDLDPEVLTPLRLETGRGILLGADADPEAVRAALVGQPVAVREVTAGSYRLLAFTPTPAPRRIDKTGWTASASENSEQARRAVDGNRDTHWVSTGPGSPGLAVTLDLGRPRDLRGVEVRPGLPGRTLRLAASLDGSSWRPIEPLSWAGSLFWTGSELLKNGGPKWAVTFPRTRLRYVRLSPAGPLRDAWTITEIECLE